MYTLALFICADIFLVNEMNGGALWSYRTKKGKKEINPKTKGRRPDKLLLTEIYRCTSQGQNGFLSPFFQRNNSLKH